MTNEIIQVAEECGYNGLEGNETCEFINDRFPNLVKDFTSEDWNTLEDAWISGRLTFYSETDI